MRSRPLRRALVIVAVLIGGGLVLPWAWSRLAAEPVHDFVLPGVAPPRAERPRTAGTLRVGAYNIAHGRGQARGNWTEENAVAREQRLLAIAAMLRAADLDVVALNEVDFDSSWSRGTDQARRIAEAAGFPHVAEAPNLDVRLGPFRLAFGNALLSRFPLRDVQVLDLPGYSACEAVLAGKKRGLAATVETPDGPVRVFAVHLSHRSEAVRAASARYLDQASRRTDLPVIIMGDMNSTPSGFPLSQAAAGSGENAMDLLAATQRWRRFQSGPPGPDGLTFHSARPDRLIDWILVPRQWSFEQYAVGDTLLSDHRPVFATVARPGGRNGPGR